MRHSASVNGYANYSTFHLICIRFCRTLLYFDYLCTPLIHWSRDKMAGISQTTVSKNLFLNENAWISMEISQNFVPKGPRYFFCDTVTYILTYVRWRHDIETVPALLALCEGNPPVTCEFPSQMECNAELGRLDQTVKHTVELGQGQLSVRHLVILKPMPI